MSAHALHSLRALATRVALDGTTIAEHGWLEVVLSAVEYNLDDATQAAPSPEKSAECLRTWLRALLDGFGVSDDFVSDLARYLWRRLDAIVRADPDWDNGRVFETVRRDFETGKWTTRETAGSCTVEDLLLACTLHPVGAAHPALRAKVTDHCLGTGASAALADRFHAYVARVVA